MGWQILPYTEEKLLSGVNGHSSPRAQLRTTQRLCCCGPHHLRHSSSLLSSCNSAAARCCGITSCQQRPAALPPGDSPLRRAKPATSMVWELMLFRSETKSLLEIGARPHKKLNRNSRAGSTNRTREQWWERRSLWNQICYNGIIQTSLRSQLISLGYGWASSFWYADT